MLTRRERILLGLAKVLVIVLAVAYVYACSSIIRAGALQ